MQIFISIFEFGEFTRLTLKTFQVHTFPTQLRLFLIFFKYIYIYNIRLALITKTDLDYQGWVFVILILNEKKVWNEINTKTINLSIKTFIHRDFTVSFVFCWSARAWQRDGFWPYWLSYFYDDISHYNLHVHLYIWYIFDNYPKVHHRTILFKERDDLKTRMFSHMWSLITFWWIFIDIFLFSFEEVK